MGQHDWIALISSVTAVVSVLIGGGGLLAYFRLKSENAAILATAEKTREETRDLRGVGWERLYKNQQAQLDKMQAELTEIESRLSEKEDLVEQLSSELSATSRELHITRQSLVEATQSRVTRDHRITELENIVAVQDRRIKELEAKAGEGAP